jgi:polysaccharide deacetylase 2 family uncharacterized protein YibQ
LLTLSTRKRTLGLFLIGLCLIPSLAAAERSEGAKPTPSVSIIIDDMGWVRKEGMRAIKLPGALAYAFLPHTPFAGRLSREAANRRKEIMLHLPMEAESNNQLLGPGALRLTMSLQEMTETLRRNLSSLPHAVGVNNHMGSLMTRKTGPLHGFMEALQAQGNLFFVDSRTTPKSVAEQVASEHRVPCLRRDVFLDNEKKSGYIEGQLRLLISKARRKGTALGIAHPHPVTLQVLEKLLPRLESEGVRLVSLTEMLTIKQERSPSWQLSLSPSPRVAKNSRR